MSKWVVKSVWAAGIYHKERNERCQDYVAVARNGNTTAIALADGAGSCSRAEAGARITAETTAQVMALHAEELATLDMQDIRHFVLMSARMALDVYCWDEDVYLKDMGSTMLVVAATEKNLVVVHLGDGWIDKTNNENEHSFLSLPENGRRRNQKYLTSMIPVLEHVRVQVIPLEGIEAVTIFSDGWEKEEVRFDMEEINTALEKGEVDNPHEDDVAAIRMVRKHK